MGIPKRRGRRGPAPKRVDAADGSEPVLVDTLAKELDDAGAFKRVCWRMGTKGPLQGDFVAIRIRSAEGRSRKQPPGEEEWLIVEREKTGEFKYYLSSMSSRATLKTLVGLTYSSRLRGLLADSYPENSAPCAAPRGAKDPSNASLEG